MKFLKASLLSAILVSSMQALPFLDLEFGGTVGADIRDGGYKGGTNGTTASVSTNGISLQNESITNTKLAYGAYARVWVGPMIKFAPFVKWESAIGLGSAQLSFNKDVNTSFVSYQNLQYGGLVGLRVPIIGLVPYAGASYSQFMNSPDLENTYAFNYGIKWEVPLIPALTLGLDASYQKPKVLKTDKRANINRLQFTIGLEF